MEKLSFKNLLTRFEQGFLSRSKNQDIVYAMIALLRANGHLIADDNSIRIIVEEAYAASNISEVPQNKIEYAFFRESTTKEKKQLQDLHPSSAKKQRGNDFTASTGLLEENHPNEPQLSVPDHVNTKAGNALLSLSRKKYPWLGVKFDKDAGTFVFNVKDTEGLFKYFEGLDKLTVTKRKLERMVIEFVNNKSGMDAVEILKKKVSQGSQKAAVAFYKIGLYVRVAESFFTGIPLEKIIILGKAGQKYTGLGILMSMNTGAVSIEKIVNSTDKGKLMDSKDTMPFKQFFDLAVETGWAAHTLVTEMKKRAGKDIEIR